MFTQIINARILTPQGWLKDGSVLIRDNKILEVTNCDLAIIGAKLIDAKGMYIVPGGVEIHVHGGGGRDFMEGTEEAFRTAIKAHMQHGTTSIFPTLSSSTIPMIRAAAAAWRISDEAFMENTRDWLDNLQYPNVCHILVPIQP